MKTYFTFLERNKLFTFVNVAGLSISLMFVLLIANMVTRQLTVEKDQRDADRIFVFANGNHGTAHYLIGEKLQSRYPEVEDWCSYTSGAISYTLIEEKPVNIRLLISRKNFFQFFSYKLIEGNPEQVLLSNTSIVLTRSCANMLFGGQPALGKTLRFPNINDQTFTVTGIMEDFNNSIIPDNIQAIIPYENAEYLNPSVSIRDNNMSNASSAMVFIRCPQGVDPNVKADDIRAYLKEIWWFGGKPVRFIPFRDFYFATDLECNIPMEQYDLTMVWIVLTAGVLILLMAVFNYISMSVAQTSYRAKEMATRRLLGSSRSDIFWRMIAESALLTFVAFVIGFLLAKAAEPIAMDLLQVKLDLVGDLSAGTLLIYIVFVLLLSYLSGFIPATILSNYNPLDVVKGTFRRKTKTIYLRTLNIVQNGLTIAMLTCALFLSVQIYRILHEPLGYTYGNILALTPAAENETLLAFRNEALKLPFVKRVCFTQGTPRDGGNNNTMNVPVQGSLKSMSFQCFIADSSFIDMFGIQITQDRKLTNDDGAWLVSENAMKDMPGITDYVPNERKGRTGFYISGTFKDFHIRRAMDAQRPLRIQIRDVENVHPWEILIETNDGDLADYQRRLNTLYESFVKDIPYKSRWYHNQMRDQYKDLFRMNKLIGVFTGAAFLISLLGLTAMSIYFIAQRKRDMAIRKVFGSSSLEEQKRLMSFSLHSIGISLLVAIPLAIVGVRSINNIIEYENSFPWWVPIASILIVSLISLVSVYLISRKATRENPVENLKTE
ncbi:ABC transporter permease [Bacteroides sp. An19]|uniref:ABC transporter permease n=1 Tax=Bacteroides sp. An19 TaxID=1965580 RepID=UPI000B36D1D2|nr:ABC transporter permease [Bacteroides sp. An19]OUP26322.1 hypothetical protein B5F25_20590 [Bacteroides sp. An19]